MYSIHFRWRSISTLLLLLLPFPLQAAPPGQSALLNGMHDIESLQWMSNATPGCDKGWITDLQYIGTQGNPGVNCHTQATKAGISLIQRLDVSGSQSYPHDPNGAAGYAKNFAYFASQCSNIHVWIVGNEPNFTVHKSDPDCSASAYAKAYIEVHKRIHALPGHQNDLVLVASNSPYSPGCLESMRQIIQGIKAAGITPDGFALHPYTRAPKGSALNAGYITNTQTQNDNTIDECSGPAKWNDTWHSHFRIYIDYIKAIEGLGVVGKPAFFTESGNACDPTISKNKCYPDADVGYFQALYKEADRWNRLPTTKTKIRAITPYRWTLNDDGTGRDFAIGNRQQLLGDLQKAFAARYNWTPPCATSNECTTDNDCPSGKQCSPNKRCVSKQCKGSQDCPGQLCSPTTCSLNPGQCIPKGSGTFTFKPAQPTPGTPITVEFTHPTGWSWIGVRYCGPQQGNGTNPKIDKAPNGQHRWSYTFPGLKAGLYRFDFTADKETNIVSTTLLTVAPTCIPQTELCNGKDDDCNGQIDDGLQRPCYDGAPNTQNIGPCKGGQQTCNSGSWGFCQGQVLPAIEQCDDQIDNDCNGQIDDACTPPQEVPTHLELPTRPDNARPDAAPPKDGGGVIYLDGGGPPTNRPKSPGCGCESGGFEQGLWWLVLLLLGVRLHWSRRQRVRQRV